MLFLLARSTALFSKTRLEAKSAGKTQNPRLAESLCDKACRFPYGSLNRWRRSGRQEQLRHTPQRKARDRDGLSAGVPNARGWPEAQPPGNGGLSARRGRSRVFGRGPRRCRALLGKMPRPLEPAS